MAVIFIPRDRGVTYLAPFRRAAGRPSVSIGAGAAVAFRIFGDETR